MPAITFNALTINSIRLLVGKDSEVYTDKSVSGLQLFVQWKKCAVRSKKPNIDEFVFIWRVRYTVDSPRLKKRTSINIGNYPELSPTGAAFKAKFIIQQAKTGVDPRAEQLRVRAATIDIKSDALQLLVLPRFRVSSIIKVWQESWSKYNCKPVTLEKYLRDLELHLVPEFGASDIRIITSKTWDDLVLDLANKQGKPGAANNLHKAGRTFFSFCVREDLIPYNPALQRQTVLKSIRTNIDNRYFESQDIHKFLNELWQQPRIDDWAKLNLELMLRLGVRVEEWERIKIGWINYKQRRIEHPGESMKSGLPAWTYLPDPALSLIAEWLRKYKEKWGSLNPDWYLFCGNTPDLPVKPVLSDVVRKKSVKDWMKFVPKMMRKTISTHLQRQGASSAVGRVIRNQALSQGVEAHYDFDQLYHLKREWLEKWSVLLDEVKVNPKALLVEGDSAIDDVISNQFDDIFG